ncbi:MAG: VCBS repeat-containing protein [Candidatus Cloacimonetes bacterium]|nr:VCBS repeat-containing protein [Candidatus Cloacimonadota bacterium]
MVKILFRISELVRSSLSHGCWFCALLFFFIPLNAIDYTVPYYPWKIDTCDINNDGRNDLIVLTSEGLCALFNNGDGTFAPYELIISGIVDIVACCQLDNIAGDDIVVLRCLGDSAGTPIQYECYYNGNFSDPIIIPFSGNYKPHHTFKYAHGDFNNDGL